MHEYRSGVIAAIRHSACPVIRIRTERYKNVRVALYSAKCKPVEGRRLKKLQISLARGRTFRDVIHQRVEGGEPIGAWRRSLAAAPPLSSSGEPKDGSHA